MLNVICVTPDMKLVSSHREDQKVEYLGLQRDRVSILVDFRLNGVKSYKSNNIG